MMIRRTAPFLLAAGLIPAAIRAEGPPPAAPPGPTVATIPVRPALEPRPSLRYRLLGEPSGRKRGNAAPFLSRACLIRVEQLGRDRAAAGKEELEGGFHQMVRWLDLPLADLPRDQARRVLGSMTFVRREVALAVECDHADWGFDRPDVGVGFQMPEIQGARELGMLLALEARLALLEGRTDDAFEAIRTGFILARLVAEGPNMVQALVGLAIADTMRECLQFLVATPDAPSLFWALAERPRPFIDLRAGLESERNLLEVEVPDLRELDRGAWTVERARRCVDALSRLLGQNATSETVRGLSPVEVALSTAGLYPEARKALLARGRPGAEVDAMPMLQVALLATYGDYVVRRDELFRWSNVPFGQARSPIMRAGESARSGDLPPLLRAMLALHADSNLEACRWAGARIERRLDALQVVEAIRLDATRRGGRLPASLDAIADLPLPPDPVTGRPFGYRVEGDTATLSGPAPGGPYGDGDESPNALRIRLVPPSPSR